MSRDQPIDVNGTMSVADAISMMGILINALLQSHVQVT